MRMLTVFGRPGMTAVLFLAAILTGGLLDTVLPVAAEKISGATDPLILVLVAALFFTLRLDGAGALRRAPRTVALAVGINFLVIPLIALAVTALLPDQALRLGVLIYCLAPCTDWFLGFTRLSGGDTATGAALIPVQLTLQLLLYPLWLALFAGEHATEVLAVAGPTLSTWFVLPAALGLGLRLALRLALPATRRARIVTAADHAVPILIALVIVAVFSGNVRTILASPGRFAWVLAAVFLFFVLAFLLGEGVARLAGLPAPEHALLTMTTSARNAPLMLALTTVALPDEPIVHAAIVLGMLIEFPHLTAITRLLQHRRRPRRPAGTIAGAPVAP